MDIPHLVAFWITIGIYLALMAFELAFAFFEKEKQRVLIKGFCVLPLAFLAIFFQPNLVGALIMAGVLLGDLGDILLIFKKKMAFFALGSVAFLLGHFSYMASMIVLFHEELHWYIPVVFAGLLLLVWLLSLYPVHKIIKPYAICLPACFYLATLFIEALLAYFLAGVADERMLITAIGATIFLSSDIYLTKCNFYKHSKREHFFIMLLYLAGQGLIVFGLLLSAGSFGI